MAISDFTLEVLGTSFTITVDEDPDYLNEILTQYRIAVENTKELFQIKEPLTAAILTGYMISEELHRIRKEGEGKLAVREDEAREAETLAKSIIARIDKVLEDSPEKT